MHKTKFLKTKTLADEIMSRPLAVLLVAIIAICMGLFFVFSQGANKPIQRDEAVAYSGEFMKYDSSRNYCGIHFKDGSYYNVYAHTETSEFQNTMESLAEGTKLDILVNPNNDYVVEIKTETEELLNFELSQQEIDSYDNGYVVLGIFICIIGVALILYAIGSRNYKRKEDARHAARKAKGNDKTDSVGMREADMAVKSRILLDANVEGYEICYRRVKSVNELVINGRVYDEKKGIIEFAHKLCATIDAHNIEAGCDEDGYSYILFDGEVIDCKKRGI